MSPKEKLSPQQKKLIDQITDRASFFRRESESIEKRRADVVRNDLKLFEKFYDGPCTINFSDQAPFVVAEGNVWETGISKQKYLRRLPPAGSILRKLNDKELIRFWEKILDTSLEIKAGVHVEGFMLPPKSRKR